MAKKPRWVAQKVHGSRHVETWQLKRDNSSSRLAALAQATFATLPMFRDLPYRLGAPTIDGMKRSRLFQLEWFTQHQHRAMSGVLGLYSATPRASIAFHCWQTPVEPIQIQEQSMYNYYTYKCDCNRQTSAIVSLRRRSKQLKSRQRWIFLQTSTLQCPVLRIYRLASRKLGVSTHSSLHGRVPEGRGTMSPQQTMHRQSRQVRGPPGRCLLESVWLDGHNLIIDGTLSCD